jgi:DNA-binding response OmpR family regulator
MRGHERAPRPRILVADDDPGFRQLLGEFLGPEGYEVEGCVDAAQALARLAARPPDLLILDRRLPGGGGLAVLDALARRPAAAPPVLVCSALGPAESPAVEWALAARGAAFLGKPFHLEELLAAVRALLAGAPRPAAPPG